MVTIKKKGEKITSVEIKKSEGDTQKIDVALENDVSIIDSDKINEVEPKIELKIDTAPIKKGEIVGTATYSINGEDYTSNILASESVTEEILNNENNSKSYEKIIEVIIIVLIITILIIVLKKVKRRKVIKETTALCIYKRKSKYKRGKHSI